MRIIGLLGTSIVAALIGACSSGGSGGGAPGTCVDVSGTWTLSGSCPVSSCSVSQNGCDVSMLCGSDTFSGTVSGSSLSFSNPQAGTCSASVSPADTSGSCTSSAGTCTFSGSCSSGPCGSSSSGGGGGSGGFGGGGMGGGGTGGGGTVDCNTACANITSCCTNMTMSDCLLGCEQNPNPTAACNACFANTSCGSFVPCVVASCGVPSELCPAPVEP